MTRYIGRHAGISQEDAILEMFAECWAEGDERAAAGWAGVAFYRAEAQKYRSQP